MKDYAFFFGLPEVPAKQRPKMLYHEETLPLSVQEAVRCLGWEPVDTRLMPDETDTDRVRKIKAILTGTNLGSIEISKERLKVIEFEARAVGLIGTKETTDQSSEVLPKADLEAMFPFANKSWQKHAAPKFSHPGKPRRKVPKAGSGGP